MVALHQDLMTANDDTSDKQGDTFACCRLRLLFFVFSWPIGPLHIEQTFPNTQITVWAQRRPQAASADVLIRLHVERIVWLTGNWPRFSKFYYEHNS